MGYNCDLINDYKHYRNTLTRIVETAKRNYYNAILTEEKHNTEKLNKIINGICKFKDSTRTFPNKLETNTGCVADKPEGIAQILNDHFANIGHLMSQSISKPSKHYNHLSAPTHICSSFFLQPSTSQEVSLLIDQLKNKKAVRYDDVETKYKKYAKQVIAPNNK